MFIVQHIDSLIQIVAGAFCSWIAFRRSARPATRATKILRVCGPALIVIGSVLLFQPAPATVWQRQSTSDHVASAEFPGSPTPKESTDTMGTVTVKRTSFTYDVPGKDIALFLSSSAIPEAARAMTDAQRIEATLAYLVSQGSKVIQNETDASGRVHWLTVRQDATKNTMRMALAYVGGNVYRVVASWSDGQGDQALTDRFVSSFRIEPGR
jgi:hypothetical protein